MDNTGLSNDMVAAGEAEFDNNTSEPLVPREEKLVDIISRFSEQFGPSEIIFCDADNLNTDGNAPPNFKKQHKNWPNDNARHLPGQADLPGQRHSLANG